MLKTWHIAAFDGLEFVQSAGITQALPPHFHEAYSIGLVMHGVQRLHLEADTLLAGPGSLLLASPYQVLAHTPLPGTEWAHKMLHVSPDAIRYLQRQGYIPRHHSLSFAAPVADFSAWAARYEQLHHHAGTLSEADLGLLLGSLFTEQRPADAPTATAPLRRLVQDVQDYLHEARQHKLSLEALAQRFALSKYQLIRYFSRFTGITPNKYLTILRVEQAKSLLAAGQPLVDVALEVGFYDQSHFAHYFQAYTGLTPGAYQRSCNLLQD
jgi:AraC-like DNA-binding protein